MTTQSERLHGVGIDFGTSNSTICRVDISGGWAEFVPASDLGESPLIPSAVFVDSDRTFVFGNTAQRRQGTADTAEQVIANFKRVLRANEPIHVPGVGAVEPVEVLRKFLGYLKKCYEQQFREACTSATITVPASEDFDADYRERVRRAVMESPGAPLFEQCSIITEPDAVLLSLHDLTPFDGQTLLVFDMGGGTLDVAIRRVEIVDDRPHLSHLAVYGSPTAGLDITRALGAHVISEWERLGRVSFTDEEREQAIRYNHYALDGLKCRLSALLSDNKGNVSDDAYVFFQSKGRGEFGVKVLADELTEISRPICEDAITTLEKTIARAGLTVDQIDAYFLVGGSSKLPLIETLVREAMGRDPSKTMGEFGVLDPMQAVARGAAMHNLEQEEASDPAVPDTAPKRPILESRIPYAISLVVDSETDTKVLVEERAILPTGPESVEFYVPGEGDTEVSIRLVRGKGHPAETTPLAGRTVYFGRPQARGAPFRISWSVAEDGLLTLMATDKNGEDLAVFTAPTLEGQ